MIVISPLWLTRKVHALHAGQRVQGEKERLAATASEIMRFAAMSAYYTAEDGLPILLSPDGRPLTLDSVLSPIPPLDPDPPILWLHGYREMQSFFSLHKAVKVVFVLADEEEKKGGGGAKGGSGAKGGAARLQRKRAPGTLPPVEWGKPDPLLCREAERVFRRLIDMADTGVEVAPNRWDYQKLAVRAETGDPFPARRWEVQSTPTVLVGVDNSGSIGDYWQEIVIASVAIAHVFPHMVVCSAWNAEPLMWPLYEDTHALWAGQAWMPKSKAAGPITVSPAGQKISQALWRDIATECGAVAAIYVGDHEINMAAGLAGAVPRMLYLSNQSCNYHPPRRSQPREVATGWGRLVDWADGVGSAWNILKAIELLL